MRHWNVFLVVAALAGLSPGTAWGQKDKPPNIVVFLIDDLGWTDLGCYGSDLHETPNLDRLAKEGVKFTQAYSACTVCSPTRAALMTGKYPARLHITDWIHGHKRPNAQLLPPRWTEYLPHEEVTVAELLKKKGYTTAHIGKWHLGDDKEQWPDRHGFDLNIGGTGRGQPPSYFSPYRIPTLTDGPQGEYLTDRLAVECVKFIEKNRDRPFFLYVPHFAVHTPIQAKKELTEKFQKKIKQGLRHQNPAYAAMIASMDEAVGKVLDRLRELKLEDRTLVIFTSDNGGLLSGGQRRITSNVPLRAGKGSAYEGGVRVPAIVRWPGVAPAGGSRDQPIITMDFFITMLAAAGFADFPASTDGIDLTPILKDARAATTRNLYWHYPHYHPGGATPHGAIRAGDYRLVEFYEDDRVELYDLKKDIGEKNDLSKTMPEKAAQLRQRLQAWRKEVKAQMPGKNPNFKPANP